MEILHHLDLIHANSTACCTPSDIRAQKIHQYFKKADLFEKDIKQRCKNTTISGNSQNVIKEAILPDFIPQAIVRLAEDKTPGHDRTT